MEFVKIYIHYTVFVLITRVISMRQYPVSSARCLVIYQKKVPRLSWCLRRQTEKRTVNTEMKSQMVQAGMKDIKNMKLRYHA